MRPRPTTVLAIVAALIVLLAIVAAVLAEGRERPTLDPGTPEGVVQLYVQALFDDDVAAAIEYLDPALGCSDPLPEPYLADTARVSVVTTTTNDDTATVELAIEEGGLLEGSWSHPERFTLIRNGEQWLITGDPWPIYECR